MSCVKWFWDNLPDLQFCFDCNKIPNEMIYKFDLLTCWPIKSKKKKNDGNI